MNDEMDTTMNASMLESVNNASVDNITSCESIDNEIDFDENISVIGEDIEDFADISDIEDFGNIGDIGDIEDFGDIGDIGDIEDIENIDDLQETVDNFTVDNASIPQPRLTVYHYLWKHIPNYSEWNHFVYLCEKYISPTQDTTHYIFWNLVATCAYCVCIKKCLPVVVDDIIECDKRITRNRMTKIGKNIRISENVTGSLPVMMSVRLLSRMAEREFQSSKRQYLPEKDVIEKLTEIENDAQMVGVNLYSRLILIYSLFIPPMKGFVIQSDDIDKACIFFRQPCTVWLLEMCQKYQMKQGI